MREPNLTPKSQYMQAAIEMGSDCGAEHPVGAVVVREGEIVGRACNQSHLHDDNTYHAEKLAMAGAKLALGSRRLDGCQLYSTMEPCTLICAGLIVANNVSAVVYGTSADQARIFSAEDPERRWRASGISLDEFTQRQSANPPTVLGGFMQEECANLLRLTPRSAEACLDSGKGRLHIVSAQPIGHKLTRFRFNLGQESYDVEAPLDTEALLSWLPNYATKAPQCGECERLIFPGQAVSTSNGGVFSHTGCCDTLAGHAGWLDNNAQLVPAYP